MMKIKKKYIAIAVIIVAASLYLYFRNADRTHYDLPVLEEIESARITRLEISRPSGALVLARRGEGWVVDPQGYPVDRARIDEILAAVGGLTATSLVSVSGNYPQYDLGPETKIAVAAYSGAQSLRRFEVGKPASTHRHTYVTLEGDPRIYKVRENIRRLFEIETDRIRDRGVHRLERQFVTGLSLAGPGGSVELTKVHKPLEPAEEDGRAPETVVAWETSGGVEADAAVVDAILNRIVNLQADGFPEALDAEDLGAPEQVLVTTGAAPDTLSIFGPYGEDRYLAASSQYAFPFLLAEWKVNQIRKSPEEVLGTAK